MNAPLPPRVVITGGTGFIGGALLARLLADGHLRPIAAVRRSGAALPDGPPTVPADALLFRGSDSPLAGAQAIVHCAARVHVMRDSAVDPLAEFRRVNVDWTLELARAAAAAGVRRFVFVSSVKVNGEETMPGRPFRADDPPAPSDPYGQSKFEAEQGLRRIAKDTGLEVVIVRPPLVYGPGVRANFRSLMRVVRLGLPLPLGGLRNRRSLVSLDNLVDLLVICISHSAAADQTFMVSDGEDLSTSELLERLARSMDRPARLFPCPPRLLETAARALGRPLVAQRLLGSLQVDIAPTCAVLGWRPPLSVEEGLRRAVREDAALQGA